MANKTPNYGLTQPLPEDFYDIQIHNDNMDIIDTELKNKAPSGYGLGTTLTEIEDANSISGTGFYYTSTNVPQSAGRCYILHQQISSSHATQIAITQATPNIGLMAFRQKYDGLWREWQWITPQMERDVEYITTERIDTKHVYKRNKNGVIQYRLDGESVWKPYANAVGAATKPTFVTATMNASGWSGKTYSFESTYPKTSYDISIEVAPTATAEQFEAFGGAMICGSADSNIATALGDVPTVNVPIIIKVVAK